jgi:hypothetical protein
MGHFRLRFVGNVTALALAFICASGCGDGLPPRVPVSGKVTIDGQPVTFGSIRFVPADGGRLATAQIANDGSFTLTAYKLNDGCVPGTHRVAVYAVEEVNDTTGRWYVPRKYSIANSSGLSYTITEPTDSLKIELTWGGVKGPVVDRLD